MPRMMRVAAVVAVAVVAGGAAVGGWVVVTVDALPDHYVAGREYTVTFRVRQHGQHLVSGLDPELLVRTSPGRWQRGEIRMPAVPLASEGTYAATFTAPAAQRVYLTIKSGFGGWGDGQLHLYPQAIVADGASPPAAEPYDRGRLLFVAKGCNTCHVNNDLADGPDNPSNAAGPDLSGRRYSREYLLRKLTDPASVPIPGGAASKMPRLGLADAEVGALAAFLNADRVASR